MASEGFKLSTLNGVKVYNLTAGKALPSFLSDRQKRNLNKRAEFAHRVQLIQDFEFPTTSSCIRMSRNGEYIVAGGCYKPMIRIFELSEMGMKCERFVDSEVVRLEVLSDDYRKLLLLQADRTLEVHAAYGRHFRCRIPKFGRDLMYQRPTAEVFVAASGTDVYRLSLEAGQFLAPLVTASPSINALDLSPLHHLLGCAGEDGVVECFDTRQKQSVARLIVSEKSDPLTAIRFDSDGLTMGCGDSEGRVAIYDLRRSTPVVVKEHPNELPINSIRFHHGTSTSTRRVLSADTRAIRIWDMEDHRSSTKPSMTSSNKYAVGTANRSGLFTTIEAPAGIAEVCLCPRVKGCRANDSGLIMAAGEQSKIMTFYVPDLGPAPKWCRYLENITEELETASNSAGAGTNTFDDYKFVTRDELSKLQLDHLVGTPLLKAYMHGYFMDARLYNRSKAVAEPDAFSKWRKKKIQEKLEAKQGTMINMKRRLPKVNPQMALRLLAEKSGGLHRDNGEALEAAMLERSKKEGDVSGSNLIDERFAGLFEDDDFEIDEKSEQFKLANPSGITRQEADLRKKVGIDGIASAGKSKSKRNADSLESYQGFELVEDVGNEDEANREDGRRQRGLSDDEELEDDDILSSDRRSNEWKDRGDNNKDLERDGEYDGLLGLGGKKSQNRVKDRNKKKRQREPNDSGMRSLKFFEMREGGDVDLVPSTMGRKEAISYAKRAQKRSRMKLSDRIAAENDMMTEAKKNHTAQRKHEFSYTPTDVLERRKREREEKLRRRERRRNKRGMTDLLPKKKQGQDYWKKK